MKMVILAVGVLVMEIYDDQQLCTQIERWMDALFAELAWCLKIF